MTTAGPKVFPKVRVPHVAVDAERIYVWDAVVRVTHWAIAFSMVVLAATGIYIGNPDIVGQTATTGGFLMGWMKVVHAYAAIVFTTAVLARVMWMFLGTQYAKWDQLLPIAKERRKKMVGTFLFYMFLRKNAPPVVGHNPLAGLTYVAVFGLYALMILTGFALFSVSAHVDSPMQWFSWLVPLFGGPQLARWIHHVAMWLLIGFAIHHVFSSILMSMTDKNGEIDSIVSGYKHVPRDELDDA
jgi:Ni/Fe-hydrogenase 1 B-type cytochrome subunit